MKQRLFVALELPEEPRARLAGWGATVARDEPALRALDAGALHVTLVFLGWRDEEELPAIGAAVRSAAGGARVGRLAVTQAAWLPPRRPGVLVADLAEAGEGLAALQRRLVEALRDHHEPETRPFRAHVTVGRVRRGARVRGRDVPPPPPLTLAPEAVALERSHLGRGGGRYETVVRVGL